MAKLNLKKISLKGLAQAIHALDAQYRYAYAHGASARELAILSERRVKFQQEHYVRQFIGPIDQRPIDKSKNFKKWN